MKSDSQNMHSGRCKMLSGSILLFLLEYYNG